jgi:DNA-binding NtrC family response regulator
MESDQDNRKWILPPGLLWNAREFEAFFSTIFNSPPDTKSVPIIIYGPRGSGKTLLTHIFLKLYRAKRPKIREEQIVRLNIAALPQNLVESELFGYVPGAFTGALSKGKKGLVEMARGGVLILEEIGELQKFEQAKLLTFIEDRIYYKVGDVNPKKWPKDEDIQIICTTNKEPDQTDRNGERFFREDFVDRFHCFSVSPIHKRRGDMLYHLFQEFPELIQSLQPYQVLALLAYNWPGNVREIERVGQYIKMLMKNPWGPPRESGLLGYMHFLVPPSFRTSLNIFEVQRLEWHLKEYGIRVQKLERELNRYGLGMMLPPDKKSTGAFKKQLEPIELQDETNKFGVRCYKIEAFEKARDGFSNVFCPLFRQAEGENKDLVDVKQWDRFWDLPTAIEENHKDLADEILRFLQRFTSRPEGASPTFPRSENIFDMPLKKLQRYYFEGLLHLNQGKTKAVARQAGLPESTCRDQLKRLGLMKPKTTNN